MQTRSPGSARSAEPNPCTAWLAVHGCLRSASINADEATMQRFKQAMQLTGSEFLEAVQYAAKVRALAVVAAVQV